MDVFYKRRSLQGHAIIVSPYSERSVSEVCSGNLDCPFVHCEGLFVVQTFQAVYKTIVFDETHSSKHCGCNSKSCVFKYINVWEIIFLAH